MAGCSPAATVAPPAAASVSPVAEPATTAPEPRIDSASNFRDVAGSAPGIPLPDGARMARGVVFRSGKLSGLSGEDRAELAALGVSDIFDLRTEEVARRSPDRAIDGARYHLVNLYGVYSKTTPEFSTVADARAERAQLNREFVTTFQQRVRTATLLRSIAEARGPVIIHCTEGKDRTGWVSALLQLTAGAGEDAVFAEYELSNDERRDEIEARVAEVRREQGDVQADIARVQLEVDRSYLAAGLDELSARYADLDGFLTKGLGLDQATIDALRGRLRQG